MAHRSLLSVSDPYLHLCVDMNSTLEPWHKQAIIMDPLLNSVTLLNDTVQTSTWYDREPIAQTDSDISDDQNDTSITFAGVVQTSSRPTSEPSKLDRSGKRSFICIFESGLSLVAGLFLRFFLVVSAVGPHARADFLVLCKLDVVATVSTHTCSRSRMKPCKLCTHGVVKDIQACYLSRLPRSNRVFQQDFFVS